MTIQELKQVAFECLAKAFKGEEIPVHVVQAAVAVSQAYEEEKVPF